MSGNWKSTDTNGDGQPDAPRNGHYVLTADLDMGPLMKKIGKTITEASGKETDGYMLPLSANKKENADTLMIATVYWKRKGESRTFPMVRRTRIMQKKPIKLKQWVSGTLSATVLLSCVNTAVFAVEASPAAVQKPELMVTELVPDTENFTGTDGKASDAYEFIELYKEGPCFAV